MTKREAKMLALDHACGILETSTEGGWPHDADNGYTEAECNAIQDAMGEVVKELQRRLARFERRRKGTA